MHRRLRRGLRRGRRHRRARRARVPRGALSPRGRLLAPGGRVPDAADRGGLGLGARRRLRAGPDLRHDRRLRDGRVRPARDHARDHPRRRRHPAPRPRGRQAARDGAGAHRPPLRRSRGRSGWGSSTQVAEQARLARRGARARPPDRLAPAARRAARQAGGAGRRGDLARGRASSRSAASTSWRWRPRTGSRACRPSSRSASPSSRDDEGEPLPSPTSTPSPIARASPTATPGSVDQAGAERLGASLYEVEPGQSNAPVSLARGERGDAARDRRGASRCARRGASGSSRRARWSPSRAASAAPTRSSAPGSAPARYLILSEMRGPEIAVYPDSKKVGVRQGAPGDRRGHEPQLPRARRGRLLARRESAHGEMTSFLDPSFDDVSEREGFRGRRARLGRQAGCRAPRRQPVRARAGLGSPSPCTTTSATRSS